MQSYVVRMILLRISAGFQLGQRQLRTDALHKMRMVFFDVIQQHLRIMSLCPIVLVHHLGHIHITARRAWLAWASTFSQLWRCGQCSTRIYLVPFRIAEAPATLNLQLLELTFSYFKLLVQIVALRRAIFVNLLAFCKLSVDGYIELSIL